MPRSRRLLALLVCLAPASVPGSSPALAQDLREVRLAVRDRLGRPVTDASACLLPACEALGVAREKDELVVRLAVSAEPMAIRVTAPGFLPGEVRLGPGAKVREEVVLRARGGLRASFLSADGKRPVELTAAVRETTDPAAGTRGRLLVERRLTLRPRPEPNRVTFDDVPPGPWVLSWEGAAVAAGTKAVRVAAEEVDAGVLALQEGTLVQGFVNDEAGGVVTGAVVTISASPSTMRSAAAAARRATSGTDGTFAVPGVPVGESLAWQALADGFRRARGTWGGETRLAIVLSRAQRVTGRLVDPDKRPVAGESLAVSYRREDSKTRAASLKGHSGPVRTGQDGAFVFHREELDLVEISTRTGGYLPLQKTLDPLPESGAKAELDLGDLVLERGRTLRGRVVEGKTGAPVAGADVATRFVPRAGTFHPAHAISDEVGTFELAGLKPGAPALLVARKSGFAPATVDVPAEDEKVEIALGTGGRIEGRVCGPPWELARAQVWYGRRPGGLSSSNSLEVDGAGRFRLDNAEPGRYDFVRAWVIRDPASPMSIRAMGGLVRGDVTVEDGATAEVRIACDGILVSGSVVRDGKPAGDSVLALAREGANPVDGFTDPTGRFSIRVPAPGRYDVWGAVLPAGTSPASGGCDVPSAGMEGCLIDLTPVPAG